MFYLSNVRKVETRTKLPEALHARYCQQRIVMTRISTASPVTASCRSAHIQTGGSFDALHYDKSVQISWELVTQWPTGDEEVRGYLAPMGFMHMTMLERFQMTMKNTQTDCEGFDKLRLWTSLTRSFNRYLA
jgi:hypothetical protein